LPTTPNSPLRHPRYSASVPTLPTSFDKDRNHSRVQSSSYPNSSTASPRMDSLPEENDANAAAERERAQLQSSSSASTTSDRSTWSNHSDHSRDTSVSLGTFVDLKDASFVFD
ncbi:hypothetical protein KEM55_002558, partial [Ascosphaera atra]